MLRWGLDFSGCVCLFFFLLPEIQKVHPGTLEPVFTESAKSAKVASSIPAVRCVAVIPRSALHKNREAPAILLYPLRFSCLGFSPFFFLPRASAQAASASLVGRLIYRIHLRTTNQNANKTRQSFLYM